MKERSNKPSVSAVICTLNEEENLPFILPKIPQWVDEIVLVDGHSTDRTIEVAKKLVPHIRTTLQPGKGKGNALKHGIEQATGEIIVTLDADGATDPEVMQKFIDPLIGGYDFVKGSRLANGRPPGMLWHRWFGNKVLSVASNTLHGTKYTDICSGYNAFWKDAFLRLKLTCDGFEMEQEMNVRIRTIGLKVTECPVQAGERLRGSSKVQDVKQGWIDLVTIVRECFRD